jgi:hypothetical protein
VEVKHGVLDLLTKIQPDPLRIFGENPKTSPTGKFTAHVVTGTANSNSPTNSSYGKVSSYEGRFNGLLGVIWT